MNATHAELWRRIRVFPLDEPGSDFTFTQRLARENGWDPAYAIRVVDEYRRFVLLGVAAGHPVSPSDEVDQAWHLHMTYTRSYWERFCREVLGKPMHHEPTRGGLAEARKFAGWYEKTLGSYRAFFGQEPPRDIWPDVRARFSEDARFERVNLDRNLTLSKARLGLAMAMGAATAGAWFLFAFGENIAAGLRTAMSLRGPEFLGYYFVLFIAVLAGGLLFRRTQRAPADAPTGEEFDLHPYEVAYLAGGTRRSINAAIAGLVGRGALRIVMPGHKFRSEAALEGPLPPLDRALLWAAPRGSGVELSKLRKAGEHEVRGIHEKLDGLGLLVTGGRDFVARAFGIVAVLATTSFGVAKIAVGMERHRPTLFLILLVILSGIAGIAILGRRLVRTRRGDRALDRLRHEHGGLEAKARTGLKGLDVPMAAGLFGLAVLGGDLFDALKETLKPPSGSSGGCGGGCSGCGGGGCGGGGCGGCGG